jgi:hypothetical protein
MAGAWTFQLERHDAAAELLITRSGDAGHSRPA